MLRTYNLFSHLAAPPCIPSLVQYYLMFLQANCFYIFAPSILEASTTAHYGRRENEEGVQDTSDVSSRSFFHF